MRLTLDTVKSAPFSDVLEACYQRLSEYEAGEDEDEPQLRRRISRTLDEVPDLHTFFLAAKAWFGHMTDGYASAYGTRSEEYKMSKSRRDLMDDMARAARTRYEGASRRLTQLEDERKSASMPTGR